MTHRRIQDPHASGGPLFLVMMIFLPLALVIFGVHTLATAWGICASATSLWMLRDLRTARTCEAA